MAESPVQDTVHFSSYINIPHSSPVDEEKRSSPSTPEEIAKSTRVLPASPAPTRDAELGGSPILGIMDDGGMDETSTEDKDYALNSEVKHESFPDHDSSNSMAGLSQITPSPMFISSMPVEDLEAAEETETESELPLLSHHAVETGSGNSREARYEVPDSDGASAISSLVDEPRIGDVTGEAVQGLDQRWISLSVDGQESELNRTEKIGPDYSLTTSSADLEIELQGQTTLRSTDQGFDIDGLQEPGNTQDIDDGPHRFKSDNIDRQAPSKIDVTKVESMDEALITLPDSDDRVIDDSDEDSSQLGLDMWEPANMKLEKGPTSETFLTQVSNPAGRISVSESLESEASKSEHSSTTLHKPFDTSNLAFEPSPIDKGVTTEASVGSAKTVSGSVMMAATRTEDIEIAMEEAVALTDSENDQIAEASKKIPVIEIVLPCSTQTISSQRLDGMAPVTRQSSHDSSLSTEVVSSEDAVMNEKKVPRKLRDEGDIPAKVEPVLRKRQRSRCDSNPAETSKTVEGLIEHSTSTAAEGIQQQSEKATRKSSNTGRRPSGRLKKKELVESQVPSQDSLILSDIKPIIEKPAHSSHERLETPPRFLGLSNTPVLVPPKGETPSKDVLMAELKAMKMASIQARNAALEVEIAAKRAKLAALSAKLTNPAGETVKRHIKLLHDYNDIRDVGQGLIGMIADNRGVRIGELYEEFGVGLKD